MEEILQQQVIHKKSIKEIYDKRKEIRNTGKYLI